MIIFVIFGNSKAYVSNGHIIDINGMKAMQTFVLFRVTFKSTKSFTNNIKFPVLPVLVSGSAGSDDYWFQVSNTQSLEEFCRMRTPK